MFNAKKTKKLMHTDKLWPNLECIEFQQYENPDEQTQEAVTVENMFKSNLNLEEDLSSTSLNKKQKRDKRVNASQTYAPVQFNSDLSFTALNKKQKRDRRVNASKTYEPAQYDFNFQPNMIQIIESELSEVAENKSDNV